MGGQQFAKREQIEGTTDEKAQRVNEYFHLRKRGGGEKDGTRARGQTTLGEGKARGEGQPGDDIWESTRGKGTTEATSEQTHSAVER